MKAFTFPLRIGRKQKRAILDSNGLEVVIFPVGNEKIAALTVELLNQDYCNRKSFEEIGGLIKTRYGDLVVLEDR